ncbi:uncharacterized protein, partial [Miscanthus floridulus]|uniref:uncharacterized protein n=1 Tax=Miscanthus floridulus TaxID=154761 RepID=UPI00345760A5
MEPDGGADEDLDIGGGGASAVQADWLEGMDPKSTFMLNFKHLGNPKKTRKDLRCFCFEKIVDSDRTNLKDLIQSIIEQYPPGYMEVAHLQYHDHILKSFPEVKTDQDLMLMFERHMNTKVVDMFIAYCDPSEQYHPITEWDSDDAYLRNPQPENEHVGVDDEGMYNEPVHGLDLVVYSAKDKDKQYVLVEDDEDEVESGSELGKVRVKKNSFQHTCSSTRRKKKVVNATKHWICEKVKDWLIDDATLGAKALQKKLKEHHKIWFMQLLKDAIGSPNSLAICTDAGQAIMNGVKEVFPQVEHRECMFHLVTNFKKKFHGKVFDDHLWAAAYSWNPYVFEKHWLAMEKEKPAATAYLRKCHSRLWTRSQFSTRSKVDYVTNNLAESFNNWIKEHKSLNLDDFLDKIRQLLMSKWNQRRKISRKLDGLILPHIIKKLNEQSRELELEVKECSEEVGEVTTLGGSGFRFVVNLLDRTCSCRQWQVSGIPCRHAIAFITSLSNAALDNYVDPYYSVDKFRVAYAQLIPAMPDKTQWPKATHEFFMYPPL